MRRIGPRTQRRIRDALKVGVWDARKGGVYCRLDSDVTASGSFGIVSLGIRWHCRWGNIHRDGTEPTVTAAVQALERALGQVAAEREAAKRNVV